MSCYKESEIADVVLSIIKQSPGIRTSELISSARQIMNPTGEDCKILAGRQDDKFSQKVRNLKSHNTLSTLVETTDEINCRWYLKK